MMKEKSKLDEEMTPTFPNNKILCRDCENRKSGVIGFKNAYCNAYPEGKPNPILFENADCEFYKKE